MNRPDSARRKPSERKVQWHIPSWLMGCLIAGFFLLLGGITAQSLMQAWLTRQTEAVYAAEAGGAFEAYAMKAAGS